MPRLLVFAPCLQAIHSAQDGTLSLVSIFSGFDISPQDTNEPPPPGAALQVAWSVGSLWKKDADNDIQFVEQSTRLLDPLNEALFEVVAPLNWERPTTSIINRFSAFPIAPLGEYKIEVALRTTPDSEWQHVHTFPVVVRQAPAAEENAAP
jgi:hypothetical protein